MNDRTSTRVAWRVPPLLGGMLGLWLLVAGCVDTYSGTRMEMGIQVDSQLDTNILVLPTPGLQPGDDGYFSHYEIHANIRDEGLVRLATFLVQPVLHVETGADGNGSGGEPSSHKRTLGCAWSPGRLFSIDY